MPAFVWEFNFALWIMIGCAAEGGRSGFSFSVF